ncbi:Rho GTPase, putative [Entamoeba invadens IP1]|uniref:small monomeric GTPase n=1 Tax=Entamoeba invadens IP1 TaxID=370355 RepID=A0A0A1UHH3_ENTIV|nr:Rho GTPase, putative [Entamoeba invadens IP1]ELP95360.1 Rho GTPase, putative [Entamoeba invadens IP1]|eukprot:XP_004262131.1 Rho GTPase, putative [Entamoeba invadens IP1]
MATPKNVKLVIVGDGAVGKTCILCSYTSGSFPTQYVPTVFENYNAITKVDNEEINLSLVDTAGQEEYDRLRHLSYPGCNCFLMCFSLISQGSLDNIEGKWKPEIDEYALGTPFLLIGTKADLREDQDFLKKAKEENITIMDSSKGEEMTKKLGAKKYIECSALTQFNLKELFMEAAKVGLTYTPKMENEEENKKKDGKCCQLL